MFVALSIDGAVAIVIGYYNYLKENTNPLTSVEVAMVGMIGLMCFLCFSTSMLENNNVKKSI